jgi:hypothetical protein
MFEIEKWVPPAGRHASLSATRLSAPWQSHVRRGYPLNAARGEHAQRVEHPTVAQRRTQL